MFDLDPAAPFGKFAKGPRNVKGHGHYHLLAEPRDFPAAVEFAREHNKPVNDFQLNALQALMSYQWPGNVRELRSEIERAVVLCQKDKIELSDLSPTLRSGGSLSIEADFRPLAQDSGLSMKEAEKQLIIRALKDCRGNRTMAAKKLGMSRRTLHRKLLSYRLEEHADAGPGEHPGNLSIE